MNTQNIATNINVLHLTLKKKWFDMIASGEKKEEYREIKSYWWNRLVRRGRIIVCTSDERCYFILPVDQWKMNEPEKYDFIEFRNGYQKNAPKIIVECKGIEIGEAKPEWSDNWKGRVFIIKLGNIVNYDTTTN